MHLLNVFTDAYLCVCVCVCVASHLISGLCHHLICSPFFPFFFLPLWTTWADESVCRLLCSTCTGRFGKQRWQIRLWWSCFEWFGPLIRQPGGERPFPPKSQRQLRAKLLFHLFDAVVGRVRSPRLCYAETCLFHASTQTHVCLKRLKCLREHSHIWMLLLRNAMTQSQWIILFFHLLIEN